MSKHLPECDEHWMQDREALFPYCICNALRACEQRVRLEMALTHEREWIEARDAGYEAGLKATHEDPNILASYSWSQGYAAALDAAREAVAALPPSPLPERWGVRTAMNFRGDVLAAIDTLRKEMS